MSRVLPIVWLGAQHDVLPDGDTLPADSIHRSGDAGNALTLGNDGGLYVAPTAASLTVADTNTVDLVGDGSTGAPLSANVRLSGAGNIMTANAGGLLVVGANSNSTIAGTSYTEAVTPNGLKTALNSGAKYPINISYEGAPGTGGTTLQARLTHPGGGGAPNVIRADATTTGDSGSVRLVQATVNSANNVYLYGLDLSVQSSVAMVVYGINADVKGSTACSGLNITLSTNATYSVNSLRFTTSDNGLYVKGNIVATGTITPSDARLKRNVCPVEDALAFINALRVVTFEKVDPDDVGRPDARYVPGIGVLAQELQPLAPEHVETLSSGYLGVHDHAVFYRLVRAVQELAARVDALESRP